jgi:hypothetical protein
MSMHITLDRLAMVLEELRQDYQREEDQAILQRDMDKAVRSLVGKEAIVRIKNHIGLRVEIDQNVMRMAPRIKKA